MYATTIFDLDVQRLIEAYSFSLATPCFVACNTESDIFENEDLRSTIEQIHSNRSSGNRKNRMSPALLDSERNAPCNNRVQPQEFFCQGTNGQNSLVRSPCRSKRHAPGYKLAHSASALHHAGSRPSLFQKLDVPPPVLRPSAAANS